MRRAGDGESPSIAFLIRGAGAKESKIDELSRLELEAFGLRKIERRSASTEILMSLQAYFVWRHMLLLALWLVWPKVQSAHDRSRTSGFLLLDDRSGRFFIPQRTAGFYRDDRWSDGLSVTEDVISELVFGHSEFLWQKVRACSQQDVQYGDFRDAPERPMRCRQCVVSLPKFERYLRTHMNEMKGP